METFDFPYHAPSWKYEDNSVRTQFGNNYTHTAKPSAPARRIFTLKFNAMRWFLNSDGSYNLTQEPKLNLALLEAFYLNHGTWKSFNYKAPNGVTIAVKFNKPFEVPQAILGSGGVVDNIELELIEQP